MMRLQKLHLELDEIVLFLAVILGISACRSAPDQHLPEAPVADRPPNVVLIMADDLGYGDLGSYGQEQIQTPHLDRMAQEGLRFTQFYAGSAVCAPSRSVLMTGQHTGRTPIRGNRELQPIGQEPLPDSSVTVAEVLQEAGYRTGVFGKWGLGGPETEGMPHRQGFDCFYGYLCQRRAHFYYPEFLFESDQDSLWRVPLEGNKVGPDEFSGPGAGPPIEKAVYSHDAIIDEALAFIEESAEEQPFFAYVPVTIPHASLEVPDEALEPYTDEDGNSIFDEQPHEGGHYSDQVMPKAAYAAMVSRMDGDVGRIVSKLETLGLDENTIVLFTSDNGPPSEGGYTPSYFDSNGPLRDDKGSLYEGGVRVPMIAWGPRHVPAGQESDHISYLGDFMATLADLADATPPDSIDSISFSSTLLGDSAVQEKHDYLYWEFSSTQAVRMGEWKAVRQPMLTGEIELYNLREDLGETSDVADEHPVVVSEIRQIMQEAHTPSPIWGPEEE